MLVLQYGLVYSSVHASSGNAWTEDAQAMRAACAKASQLRSTVVSSDIIMFDDRVGYSVLVMSGHYKQAYMKQQRGRELCMWQRATHAIYVAEADSLALLKYQFGGNNDA